LPAVETDLLREEVEAALDREGGLVRAEAAHRAAGRVVRVRGDGLDVDGRDLIRPAGVAGGALEDLRAHGGVGARVADHARLERGERPRGVTTQGEVHLDGVALRVDADRLLAVEREADRAPALLGEERRLRLDRHVLLAAE